jgi:hypothetical protein
MSLDLQGQQQQNSADNKKLYMEPRPDSIETPLRAGARNVMSHAARLEFLKKSKLAKRLGLAKED